MDNTELYHALSTKIDSGVREVRELVEKVETEAAAKHSALSKRVGAIEAKDDKRVAKVTGIAIGAGLGGAGLGAGVAAWLKSLFSG